MILEEQIWEITGHFWETHHEHQNVSWWSIRLVMAAVVLTLGVHFGEFTGHSLKDSPRASKRLVVIKTSRFGRAYWSSWNLMVADIGTGRITSRIKHNVPFWPPVVRTLGHFWEGSHHGPLHGPSCSRRPVLGTVLHNWQMTEKFWDFGIYDFGSGFEVRGITISPPWEHSSPNVTLLNRIKRMWAIINSSNLQKLKYAKF